VALLLGAAATWWFRSGKASKFIDRARPVVRELGQIYGPPLIETFGRYEHGQVVFAQAAVPPADATTLAERIARVLAFCPAPVSPRTLPARSARPATSGTGPGSSERNFADAALSPRSAEAGGCSASRVVTRQLHCRSPR
jgi:hypothetical protein